MRIIHCSATEVLGSFILFFLLWCKIVYPLALTLTVIPIPFGGCLLWRCRQREGGSNHVPCSILYTKLVSSHLRTLVSRHYYYHFTDDVQMMKLRKFKCYAKKHWSKDSTRHALSLNHFSILLPTSFRTEKLTKDHQNIYISLSSCLLHLSL